MHFASYHPRTFERPHRRLKVLVVEEGASLNCNIFRGAEDHDYEILDCGADQKNSGSFRKKWRKVHAAIQERAYDVAVVTERKHCFWRKGAGPASAVWRWTKAWLGEPWRAAHLLVPRQLTRAGIPWALVDRNDQVLLNEGSHLFFRDCTTFFVRELLTNRYEIFQAYRRGEPGCRLWPRGPRTEYPLDKIRPISLGLQVPEEKFQKLPREKKHDIFFCGLMDLRTPRISALEEVQESAAREGWKLKLADRVPQDEFLKTCAESWLVLSPSGNGWDCWRHSEVLMAGAVPLINYPWIERYAPLRDREHVFFYSPEKGHLSEVIRKALADRGALRTMALAGAEHVRQYHTYQALRDYLLSETLRMAISPEGKARS
jgi:hypothetical protein